MKRLCFVTGLLCCLTLYGASTVAGASILHAVLSSGKAGNAGFADFQAIVVITGRPDRAARAAQIHFASGKPVAVFGEEATQMRHGQPAAVLDVLTREYGVVPRWSESRSATTRENAAAAACVLQPEKIRSIALVTDSRHMHRARLWFEHYGFVVTALATRYPGPRVRAWRDFLPSVQGWRWTCVACHEFAGLVEVAASAVGEKANCKHPA